MRSHRSLASALLSALLFSAAAFTPLPARTGSGRKSAPPAISAELRSEMERVLQAALASDYAYKELKHLTNNIGPRLAGSPQAQFAAEYVGAEMRKLGLEVTLEKTKVPHWVRGIETGSLAEYPGKAPGTEQKIVLTALGGSVGTPPDGITADVVVVRNYGELEALGPAGVAGRIVLFNVPWDKRLTAQNEPGPAYGDVVAYRADGAKAAEKLGAVAALVRSAGSADYRLPHTGAMHEAGIPGAAVTAEDAELIADLAGQGRVRMHLLLTCKNLPDAESANVIADLKGREHPDQVVVVSGHLDSWDLGTGAIDDGAGVAMAMATAAIFKQLGIQPRRTLRVIAWMDEEHLGSGSKTYALDHAAEFVSHTAAIESDFGAGHPIGFSAHAGPAALEVLKPVSDVLRATGATILRSVEYSPGADITVLSDAGVPSFGPMQDGRTYFDYHHTAADTLDKVDPLNLSENVAAISVLAAALTEMPQPLPRK